MRSDVETLGKSIAHKRMDAVGLRPLPSLVRRRSKISDQQSPIRNLEHRFLNILINRLGNAAPGSKPGYAGRQCYRV